MIPLESVENILDAGCGNCSYAIKLAKDHPNIKIKALDIEECFLNSHLKNLTFERKDLLSLEDRAQYDFIYSIDVLEHVPSNLEAIEKLYLALKQNGYLLIHMPGKFEKWFLPNKLFSDFKTKLKNEHIGEHYSLEELKGLLIERKFQIILALRTFGFLGKISQEIDILLSRNIYANILRILLMPFLKFLCISEIIIPNKSGSNLLVICKKQ
jgi:SAM-dependent methyltransferase